jgi:hypothetical protein
MRRVPLLITVTVLSVVMLGAVACEPLRNAPPGGGETITTTFRLVPSRSGPVER